MSEHVGACRSMSEHVGDVGVMSEEYDMGLDDESCISD
jgi:hypothetical protein